MNTLTLTLTMIAGICLCIGLIGGLILVVQLYQKLNRLIIDAYALQRMIVTHGDSQLSADSRLSHIDHLLSKLQQRDLEVRSLIHGLSSVENATSLIEETGIIDVERLASQSGLTEREAHLMIQLRTNYSTDIVSPPDGEK